MGHFPAYYNLWIQEVKESQSGPRTATEMGTLLTNLPTRNTSHAPWTTYSKRTIRRVFKNKLLHFRFVEKLLK